MSNFDRARWTRDAKLKSSVKALLYTLITFADNATGEAFPSISTLAYGMGVSKRTVHPAIDAAIDAEVLSATDSVGRRAGVSPHDTTRRYKIIDSILRENADAANAERAKSASMQNLHPCNPCTPRVQNLHGKGAESASQQIIEQTNEHLLPKAAPKTDIGAGGKSGEDEKVLSIVEPDGFVLAAITNALGACDAKERAQLKTIQNQIEKLPAPFIDGKEQPWGVVFTRALTFAMATISNHAPVTLARYAKKCAIGCRTTHQWPGKDKPKEQAGGCTTGKPVGQTLRRNEL